jgi:hypothetical protein
MVFFLMPTRIDPYSLSAVPVEHFFNDTLLGNATAFVWERENKSYLITNWHVVSGRNNETGKCLAAHGGTPDRLRALFRLAPSKFDTHAHDIALYDVEGNPTWLSHPVHGRKVDVVVIPLVANSECIFSPINKLPKTNLSVQVGMDVFVLGFPFGSAAPSLPVWKRGSIASEPELVRFGERYYLVDTASRPGMSGAPVILRSYGSHLTESGSSLTTEPATKFFGIYSGRLSTKDSEDAQLGRVWPESFITEIIDANRLDLGLRD